jgi:hypothetical protein
MTTRSIINLSAFAIIAAGGFMLLDARPAAAAAAHTEQCDKLMKIMATQAAQCEAQGGTYWADYSCSSGGATSLISGCD